MAEVVYSRRAFSDLERLADFLRTEAPRAAVAAIDVIIDGVEILERHPLVGRPCEAGLRELVISYGKRGYVALYSYEPRENVALILAIRQGGIPGSSVKNPEAVSFTGSRETGESWASSGPTPGAT